MNSVNTDKILNTCKNSVYIVELPRPPNWTFLYKKKLSVDLTPKLVPFYYLLLEFKLALLKMKRKYSLEQGKKGYFEICKQKNIKMVAI